MQQQDNHEYPFLYQRQTCHQVQPNQATYQKRQKCQPATYLQEVLYQLSNDGSNKLNRSRKARVSYKVQRTINASLNAATSTRAVSSNPNFVTRQKIEIIFG